MKIRENMIVMLYVSFVISICFKLVAAVVLLFGQPKRKLELVPKEVRAVGI